MISTKITQEQGVKMCEVLVFGCCTWHLLQGKAPSQIEDLDANKESDPKASSLETQRLSSVICFICGMLYET